jgi:hypothetical protein
MIQIFSSKVHTQNTTVSCKGHGVLGEGVWAVGGCVCFLGHTCLTGEYVI